MNCLKGYVGLNGCGVDTPVSGLFVNSLPGISLKTIDLTANSEQKTFFGVWNDIENRAIAKFKTDITARLASRYRLKSINQSINLGRIIDKTKTEAPEAQYKGVAIELRLNTAYTQSSLQAINVQTVSIYSEAVITGVHFKIFDIETGDELFTKAVDVIIGWNTVQVNKQFDSQRIFLAVDCTQFTTVEQKVNVGFCDQLNASLGVIYSYGGYASLIRGAKTSVISDVANLSHGSNCYGISPVFSIVCRYDNLICNNLATFATAFWYLLGAELMIQGLTSERTNWITLDRDGLIEKQQYYESEYKKEIENVLKGLSIDTSDACIDCNAPLMVKESRM